MRTPIDLEGRSDGPIPPSDEAAPAPPRPPYQVGYGRPPRDGQFKKGKSGNPAGRPKGSQSIASLMRKYGQKTMRVQMGGHTRIMTWDEIIVAQLLSLAEQGHPRARAYCVEVLQAIDAREEPEANAGGVATLPTDEFDKLAELREADRRQASMRKEKKRE